MTQLSDDTFLLFQSRFDFQTTASRFRQEVEARGMTLFAEIDQKEAAERVGYALRPTRLFLFGRPDTGTPIMELNPHAAIELPLRIVLWEADGIAFLAYRDVEKTLASEFNIPEPMTSPFGKIRALLAQVTGQAQAPIQA